MGMCSYTDTTVRTTQYGVQKRKRLIRCTLSAEASVKPGPNLEWRDYCQPHANEVADRQNGEAVVRRLS